MRYRIHPGIRLLLSVMFMIVAGYAVTGRSAAETLDAPASLTINVYTCDDLHDLIDPNQTFANECALGTEDISFTLEPFAPQSGSMSASTGSGGNPATISFSNLSAGDYRLVQQTPETIALSYVAQCTSNVRSFEYPFSPFAIIEPDGRLNLQLLPDEQLTCDWYNILAPVNAIVPSLNVTVYSCDGDVIGPEICDLAPNVDLRLFSPSAEIILTTDASGIAIFDGEGEYSIELVSELKDRVTCGILTPDGAPGSTLTLDPANPIFIEAYYCYPGA